MVDFENTDTRYRYIRGAQTPSSSRFSDLRRIDIMNLTILGECNVILLIIFAFLGIFHRT